MRKNLFTLAGIVMLICIGYTPSLFAQVYSEFGQVTVITDQPYVEIEGTLMPYEEFGLPPQFNDQNINDGYYEVELGFDYEFNGETYDKLWVNVNGFLTFGSIEDNNLTLPPFLPPRNPQALFFEENSFPVNVIAPFWGDHYMRNEVQSFQGYKQSFLSYQLDDQVDENGDVITDEDGNAYQVMTIQWKDLNINYLQDGQDIRSSVGNFQVKIYEATEQFTNQGDIEFCYGQIGGNSSDQFNSIITRGSAVGIKGEGANIGQRADFMNGLINTAYFANEGEDYDPELVRTSTMLTDEWPPSSQNGRIDTRIRFEALGRFNIEEWWGDGDVDFSKAPGRIHAAYNQVQSRFVTLNDARVILQSVATGVPLDPVRRRAAYHGDVNHNGRYYINAAGDLIPIPIKSEVYTDDLPDEVSSTKQILFRCNEYDAALILQYLSARVPELPWLLDTIPAFGKQNVHLADNFGLNNITNLYDDVYQAEITLDSYNEGAMATKFDMNAEVLDISVLSQNDNNRIIQQKGLNTVAISGSGMFEADQAIAIVRFRTYDDELNITNARLNDEDKNNQTYILNKETTNGIAGLNVSAQPNPFTESTTFVVDVNFESNYQLQIYDITGNLITNLHNGNLSVGSHTFTWNGVDAQNNTVNGGAYVVKLSNGSATITEKVIYNK